MTARTRTVRKTAKPRIGKFIILGLFIFLVALMIAFILAGFSLARSWLQDLPDYTDSDAYLLAEPTKVLDADGNTIAEFYLENRTPVTIDQVSDYVIEGTIDTEDIRFYQHNGIDPQGIMRAIVVQITGGSEGASTITQQVVRNTVLKNEQFEKTLSRKVREAYIAVQLEKMYTKDEILMMYLNSIYYGAGCYGIEAAAETYFGKTASELTLVEAATLAGLPQSPTSYDPTLHPDRALERRNTVLAHMLSAGDITQEQYDDAIATPLEIHYTPRESSGAYQYPYFVDYVKSQLLQTFSSDVIFKGGLTVKTTIDPAIQAAAEQAVNSVIGIATDDLEAALVCIDNSNGFIRAMIGGWDYNTDQFNLATQAKRQPGSSFKTFTLTAAIQEGMNPDILVNCNSGVQVGDWTVNNINNENWGIQTLRQAMYWSSNTAFALVIHEIGPATVIATAHAMGITSDLEEYDSLTLGVDGCSVLEMASGYSTLATGGIHYEPAAISEVDDRNGNPVFVADTTGTQAVTPEVAGAVTNVLEGVVGDPTATGTEAQLTVDQPVAGKTGTTDSNRDLWFVGYTPQYSAAVWCGYRTERSITYLGASGSTHTLPSPIFSRFMSAVLEGKPRQEFPQADSPVYKDNSSWNISYGTGSSASFNASSTPTTETTLSTDQTGATNAQSSQQSTSSGQTYTQSTATTPAPSTGTTSEGSGGSTGGSDSTPPAETTTETGGGTGGGATDAGTGGSGGSGGASDAGTGGGATDAGVTETPATA